MEKSMTMTTFELGGLVFMFRKECNCEFKIITKIQV
jgi:hypothetical protein